MLHLLRVLALCGAVGLIGAGCAPSSSLVEKWNNSSYAGPALGKILVIAVRKDSTKRRVWEDAFAGELAKRGVAGAASYSLFPDAPPDTSQVIAAVSAGGFDGVMVILRLPSETSEHFVKGYVSMEPEGEYYGPYWQRYWNTYLVVRHPGYIDTQTVAFSSVDVLSTGSGGKLLWNATSKTADPASVKDIQQGIASLVMRELGRRNIIGSKK